MTASLPELMAAVRRRDTAGVERLLAEGVNPNGSEAETGLTPLIAAAGLGQDGVVRRLLAAGADVHDLDTAGGSSVLHKACQAGNLETVRLLVEAGAHVNLQAASTGHTPLVEAMWFKHVEVVEYLLARNARIALRTAYGFTLSDHLAFMLRVNVRGREKIERMKALVDARIEADRAATERQVLMAATVAGDAERAKELIAAGAEVDERSPVVGGFNDHHTPLLVAARDGHTEVVRLLLAAGADVNAVEPTFGAVPLHKATYNGHAEILGLLVAHPGVGLDYQGPSNGYTPLHDALWHGYGECARILIEAGARLDVLGHDGLRPLDVAEQVLGADDTVTRLLRDRTPREQGDRLR